MAKQTYFRVESSRDVRTRATTLEKLAALPRHEAAKRSKIKIQNHADISPLGYTQKETVSSVTPNVLRPSSTSHALGLKDLELERYVSLPSEQPTVAYP